MSWIETIAEWTDTTYYETASILLLIFLCVLWCIYTICKGLLAPCIMVCNCLQCCFINPLCNACFGRSSKNNYVKVDTEDKDANRSVV